MNHQRLVVGYGLVKVPTQTQVLIVVLFLSKQILSNYVQEVVNNYDPGRMIFVDHSPRFSFVG